MTGDLLLKRNNSYLYQRTAILMGKLLMSFVEEYYNNTKASTCSYPLLNLHFLLSFQVELRHARLAVDPAHTAAILF